ncbi:MAG: transketolase [Candidatus Limnocylindria bacterium]
MTATIEVSRARASAAEVAARANAIRRHVIRMIAPLGQGYAGQGLGSADLMATLYFSELRMDPADLDWPDRDRFILSAAHQAVGLYAALVERGALPAERLAEYGGDDTTLELIAPYRAPGIEFTGGSLGQGLSVGVGMALSARRHGRDHRVYVLLGDGEMQEGQTWEAALAASSFGLDNICAIIDLNGMQVEGPTESVQQMQPVPEKWRAFGWAVHEIDGHSIPAIQDAFERARATKGRPTMIVAETRPGRGVSFLEGTRSHFTKFTEESAAAALRELEAAR